MLEILERICDGKGELEDIERLESLAETLKAGALCGLGQTAPNPVLSTLIYFKDEYLAHIVDKRCPAGVCKNSYRMKSTRKNASMQCMLEKMSGRCNQRRTQENIHNR
jgi:hypothetical protein